MKKVKKDRNQSNKKLVIGALVSVILLIGIVASVYYKNERVKEAMPQPDVQVEKDGTQERQETEKPKKQENDTVIEKVTPKVEEKEPLVEQKEPIEQQPNNSSGSEQINKSGYIEGQPEPTEPKYVNGVLIVNKKNPLPKTYNKGENPKARGAYERMATAAKKQGYELVAFSGYRSYEYQETLYTNYVNRDGKDKADRYSARPGYSEHQSGLAFDIGEKGKEDLWLTSEFGETKVGQWLVANAHQYGFILRYPKGKEEITGFMYESWHFRYLGVELATEVFEAGVTLEEYLKID